MLPMRLMTSLTLVVLAQLGGASNDAPLSVALMCLALLIVPTDLLPAIVLITVRDDGAFIGPLFLSDVAALVCVTRVVLSPQGLKIRFSASRIALLAFFLWTAFVTITGLGVLTALGRVALYAAMGVAVSYRPPAKRYLFAGIVGLAVMEIILHMPYLPSRLHGRFIDDPSHAGGLFIAALLVVWTSRLHRPLKVLLVGLIAFGIAMTLTRSVWFAVGAVAFAAALPRRWYVPLLLPPAAGLAALPLVPYVNSMLGLYEYSVTVRVKSISAGWRQFQENPIVGHGWQLASAVRELGIIGPSDVAIYNLWIHLGVSSGIVGLILFLTFVSTLAREALSDQKAYLFLVATLAMSLSEMHLYGQSLLALLFFTMTFTWRPLKAAQPFASFEVPCRRIGQNRAKRRPLFGCPGGPAELHETGNTTLTGIRLAMRGGRRETGGDGSAVGEELWNQAGGSDSGQLDYGKNRT